MVIVINTQLYVCGIWSYHTVTLYPPDHVWLCIVTFLLFNKLFHCSYIGAVYVSGQAGRCYDCAPFCFNPLSSQNFKTFQLAVCLWQAFVWKECGQCTVYRQAYLVFSSKEQVENTVKKFKRERTRLDGRRLILIRYNPNCVLPAGNINLRLFLCCYLYLFVFYFVSFSILSHTRCFLGKQSMVTRVLLSEYNFYLCQLRN